jgi:hypothetical protein
MPTFTIAKTKERIWLPTSRIVNMESAAGGLSTIVRAVLLTPQGEGLGTFEVEGRVDTLGALLDSGKPVEVGQ